MNRGVNNLAVFCTLVFWAFSPYMAKEAKSLDAVPPTLNNSQDYVRNEIIVKLRPGLADNINEALADGSETRQVWPGSLQRLNDKYKLINAQPLARGFSGSRQLIKELAGKDKSQLNPRERRILRRARRAPRGAVVPDLGGIYKIRFDLDANDSLQEIVEAYRDDPDVEYAELNHIVSAFSAPADPYYPVQWALNNTGQDYPISGGATDSGTPNADINAPEAWDFYAGGSDVIVAVIDTGVDYAHRDLAGNMWTDADGCFGYDFANDDNDPVDDKGHGTHCAGIIAARGNNAYDVAGVCWNAKIMAVKFLDAYGSGTEIGAISAIYYAVSNGADVLSNSWGGGSYLQALQDAINYAYSQGCIFVAAAGNYGTSTPVYPASYDHVISVAATDSDDNKASFSSYGEWVVLAAPGVDILSLRAENTDMYLLVSGYNPGDRFVPFGDLDATMYIASGTSMACPYVAGACALLLSANPTLTSDGAKEILADTGDPIANGICHSDGRLNLFRALTAAIQAKSKGHITLDSDYYNCDCNVGIFLTDGDLSGEGAYAVSITTSGGDDETIILAEKDPPVGAFAGTIHTSTGTLIIGDGILQVTNGDTISVSYYDTNDGTGSPATVTDTATIDCVPPVISNIQMDVRGPVLMVTFDSNEPTTGEVLCGLACGGPYGLEGKDAVASTTHTIEVSSLSPYTTYYFIVTANDVAGNRTVDSNAGNCYSFTTSGPGDMYVPSQYPTIQDAVDYSWLGSVIWVADGTYTGPGNRDIEFRGKAITVRGENGPGSCIIDCEADSNEPHRGFSFRNGEDGNSVLDGFTITNGYGPYDFWNGFEFVAAGGGIYCSRSSPTIKNCRIIGGRTSYARGHGDGPGGGIYCEYASPAIMNCEIIGNFAGNEKGAGIFGYSSNVSITNCLISDNGGSNGSGIYIHHGAPVIDRCIISDNLIYCGRGALYFEGGTRYVSATCYPEITNCLITGNRSTQCSSLGGICCWRGGGDTTISNCTIVNNTESPKGGAIYWAGSGTTTVTNCICRGNSSQTGGEIHGSGGTVIVEYSNVQGGLPGEGNIDEDPLFLATDYYYLSPSSPCIDAGTNSPPGGLPDVDLDGNPRPVDGDNNGVSTADMGAYEFDPELPIIWRSPWEFEFDAVEGGSNPAEQILSICSIGSGTLCWEVTENCPWLEVEPNSGESTGEIDDVNVSIDSSGLALGTYRCIFTVTAAGASNDPQIVVVNLYIRRPAIELSASEFKFFGIHDGPEPPDQILTIRNSSIGTLNWTIDCDCDWLQADPNMGSSTGEPNEVVLSTNCTDLGLGIYNCELTVSDPCATNSPQTVDVTLYVTEDDFDGKLLVPSEYSNIQMAIDYAKDGNTVIVADGTYTGADNRNIDFLGKAITVKSENGPANCIINCQNFSRGFNFHSGEGRESILEGFTITHAYVEATMEAGAGIYIDEASPTISRCVITDNHAELMPISWGFCLGGGIYIGHGSPLITDCNISGNSVGDWGWGGGIYSAFSSATIHNCLISDNNAVGYEGAGGGIHCNSGVTVANCTIVDNSADPGGGIYGPATVKDSIIWANTAEGGANITYSDVQGGFSGTGNINANPCFVSGPQGDYYLSQTVAGQATDSPCVDAGSDTAEDLGMNAYTTRTDEIGDMRVVDMGYHYPASTPVVSPDLNRDMFVNFIDYSILSPNWLQSPEPCEPNSGDIIQDGLVDIYDLALLVEQWLTCFVTEATSPEPDNNAADVDRYVILEWSSGKNCASHDIYFGTDFDEVNNADIYDVDIYMGNQDTTFWDVNNYDSNGLELDTVFYWRINEVAAGCTVKGNVWSFTVASLGKAANPQPSDGQVDVTKHPILSWSPATYADSRDVYFGTDFNEVNDADIYDTNVYMGNQDVNYWDTNNYAPAGLDFGTTYYWRIDEVAESSITEGDVWSFMVDSGKAENPQPSNGRINVVYHLILSWSPGMDYLSHDVYFGTDFNEVNDADIYDPNVYMGNQDVNYWDINNYAPAGLDLNTTYYWRIDEVAGSGTIKGDIWSFTTWPEPNIDYGLVAWWEFDEGSGTITYDSASDNDGTLVNGPAWTSGKINSALDFNGDDGVYIETSAGTGSPLNLYNTDVSVSAWVKFRGTGGTIVARSKPLYITYRLGISENQAYINTYRSGHWTLYAEQVLDPNTWYHLAGVFDRDGDMGYVYVDGVEKAEGAMTTDPLSNDAPTKIGCRNDTSDFAFDGVIDDVRIYNRVLSPDEVELLYQQGL